MDKKGKLIAVYGVNGIGKTTQVKLLVEWLRSLGLDAHSLKYPIYDLPPEGPFINSYLRDDAFRAANPKTANELQHLFMLNRQRFEPTLRERLASGEWIVAEDYVGTGIAWGMTWGGDLYYLENINQHLLREDIAVLMDGERFLAAVETNHHNENSVERIDFCKNFLRLLAGRYGWKTVNANDQIANVQISLRSIISSLLPE